MRQMKDSGIEWIGEIPEGWEVRKIKNIAFPKSIQNHPQEEVLSLYRDFGVIIKSSRDDNFNRTSENTTNYKFVEVGDLVINKMKAWQGALAISWYQGIVSPAYYVFKLTSDIIEKKFLHYLLRSSSYFPEYRRISGGIRPNQWDLDITEFKKIPVLIPPLAEQQRIADYLDAKCAHIDQCLELTRQSMEKLHAYKLSCITEAVTKGLDPDAPLKDSGVPWIGQIPAEWKISKLKTYASMLTPMRDKPEYLDGEIPWIRIEDFSGKYIKESKEGLGVSKETVKQMNLKVYPVGTILCTSSCELGKCAITSVELVSNQRFIGIIPSKECHTDFLYYNLLVNAERLQFLSTGTIQANLSRISFEHLQLQFPPLPEQERIAAYLDKKCARIDALLEEKQALLDKLAEYKKSLIFECVTGKREVPPC